MYVCTTAYRQRSAGSSSTVLGDLDFNWTASNAVIPTESHFIRQAPYSPVHLHRTLVTGQRSVLPVLRIILHWSSASHHSRSPNSCHVDAGARLSAVL